MESTKNNDNFQSNSQTVNVAMFVIMQCAHVCQDLLGHHHNVVQNVSLHLNVRQHLLASIKNVLIHVQERVELVQGAK